MSKDLVGWWEGRGCRAPLRCLVRSWSLLLAPSAVLIWLCTSHLQGIINLGTSENKLCFDLLSRRVSPSAPLSGIPSSEGLSSLGFPGILPPRELAACLGCPRFGVRRPCSALETTFSAIWGELLPDYDSAASPLLAAFRLSPSCWLGPCSQVETLSDVWSVFNNWSWGRRSPDL